MDNNDKTQSNDATTKTDNKTVGNKANASPQAPQQPQQTQPQQGQPPRSENKGAAQGGKVGGQTASSGGGAAAASTANQSVGDTVSGATDAIKDALGQAKETGGAVASKAYGIASEKATAVIDEQKTNLTQGLSSVADTIRQIGGNLSGAQEPTGVANIAAQYTNTAADKVEQISGYLERRDFKGLVRDLEDVAHKNPAIFLGGAFALGILAARFFKSGNPNTTLTRRNQYNSENMGGGDRGGFQVRQLRRKSTGRADTLNAGDTAASSSDVSRNMGG